MNNLGRLTQALYRRTCLHALKAAPRDQYQTRFLRTARQATGPRNARRHEPLPLKPKVPIESTELALDASEGKPTPDPHGILDSSGSHDATALVSAPTLVVCRQIEMMNIFIGFEQANKYVMYDSQGSIVGYIAEEHDTLKSNMIRNLAGTHRPFSCVIMDTKGNTVLRVSRSYAFINSYIKIHLVNQSTETLVGEVRQVFHMLRRKYELFIQRDQGMVQFGAIDEPTLSWDFSVKDEDGSTIGSISRNMRGLMRELFTDTGHYVLRMSQTAVLSSTEVVAQGENAEARAAIAATDSRALVGAHKRPMMLDERAVLLATAVAVDFDYFSKMSNNHGGMGLPMFLPFGGSYGTGDAAPPEGQAGTGQDGEPGQAQAPLEGSDAPEAPTEQPSSGNWWDEPAAQQQEQNWWDDQPADDSQGGSWMDGFDFGDD